MVGRAALRVSRRRALAARLVAQGLDARVLDVAALAVLDVGLADSPHGAARVAAAARTAGPVDDVGRPDGPLPAVWALRGAPHVHRARDLPDLARALHPVDDDDVRDRLTSPQAAGSRPLGLEAWRLVAAAAREVAARHDGVVSKSDLSREVSDRVPAGLTFWCAGCDAQHVSALTLQPAGLQAGLALDASARALVLRSVGGWPADLGVPDPTAARAHLRRLVALHGPLAAGDLATLVGTTVRALRPVLPDDLVPVEVDGHAAWATEDLAGLLGDDAVEDRAAAPVRLLPPGDPWLQSRDRTLTVPDAAVRKDLWRPLGSPGAVLVGGEVVGTWRSRAGARRAAGRRDDVVVTPWAAWADDVAGAVAEEALVVARARGADDVRLVVEDV